MLNQDKEPKKKKVGLYDKMGLDQGSDKHAPPMAQPGILPGSAEGAINEMDREKVGAAIQEKLKTRRQSNARQDNIAR